MKIIKLTAENIKKLVAVEITPEGSLVKISGKNGAGKTSILDSIWWALGGLSNVQDKPIRAGQKKARITIDLGDMVVERVFTPKSSTLTVTSKDGTKYKSPQSVLDGLIGRMSFDPLSFMHLDSKYQYETLKDISGIGDQLDELECDYKANYDKRADSNRLLRAESSKLSLMTPYNEVIDEVSVDSILLELREATAFNFSLTADKGILAALREDKDGIDSRISRLEEELADLNEQKADIITGGKALKAQLKGVVPVDIKLIQDKLSLVESNNNEARESQAYCDTRDSVAALQVNSDSFTDKMEDISAAKFEAMSEVVLPVRNLSIDDEEVLYKGVPLKQASAAEQLKVSVAIAMASNPDLKVIRITDASLLDSSSVAVIEKMANKKDYQVWMECVDETGKVGVYIEDGIVKEVN